MVVGEINSLLLWSLHWFITVSTIYPYSNQPSRPDNHLSHLTTRKSISKFVIAPHTKTKEMGAVH